MKWNETCIWVIDFMQRKWISHISTANHIKIDDIKTQFELVICGWQHNVQCELRKYIYFQSFVFHSKTVTMLDRRFEHTQTRSHIKKKIWAGKKGVEVRKAVIFGRMQNQKLNVNETASERCNAETVAYSIIRSEQNEMRKKCNKNNSNERHHLVDIDEIEWGERRAKRKWMKTAKWTTDGSMNNEKIRIANFRQNVDFSLDSQRSSERRWQRDRVRVHFVCNEIVVVEEPRWTDLPMLYSFWLSSFLLSFYCAFA